MYAEKEETIMETSNVYSSHEILGRIYKKYRPLIQFSYE